VAGGGKFEYIGGCSRTTAYPELVYDRSGVRSPRQPRWLWPALAAIGIALAFLVLNHRAYDGYFQDDELDTLTWAPSRDAALYIRGLISPAFENDNFRPVGHLFFTLMGRAFSLNFAPWVTPLFVIHFLNGALLFLILRRIRVEVWPALAAVAFFLLSAAALDAYWKPMYVFDLLCGTFCLASLLAYMHRRWILSFIAFWLAYKAKEMAVMLPAVLLVYEYWLGESKYLRLIPFLLASLSFGLQGILLNPNHNNDYTFHFDFQALTRTVPFYFRRLLTVPWLALCLPALALIRDKRVWFGLAAMLLLMVPLLFLPGRLFEAYAYLPLACASVALAAAASHVTPQWIVVALLLWAPFDLREWRRQSRAILLADDRNFAFVDSVLKWGARHPEPDDFVYTGVPPGFHSWGVSAAWILAHNRQNLNSYFKASPDAAKALASQTVVLGSWSRSGELSLRYHQPSEP
jgi:hypothetical protein